MGIFDNQGGNFVFAPKKGEKMIDLFYKIKRFFTRKKGTWVHYECFIAKDKSGRLRDHIYVDGKRTQEEQTIDFWHFKPNKKKIQGEFLKEMGKI